MSENKINSKVNLTKIAKQTLVVALRATSDLLFTSCGKTADVCMIVLRRL